MHTLTAAEVHNMLIAQPDTHLVMTLGPAAFAKAHIPGSENIWEIEEAIAQLTKDKPVIVYCTDSQCLASYYAYQQLERAGFQYLYRFAGGLRAWTEAGYPIETGSDPSQSLLSNPLS